MRLLVALSRLLTILAVVGLVMAAATAPVSAGSDGMAAMAMSGDMPDCAEKTGDCDADTPCPFMVACVAKLAPNLPAAVPVGVPLGLALVVPLRDDAPRASRAIPPPPRPPAA